MGQDLSLSLKGFSFSMKEVVLLFTSSINMLELLQQL